MKLSLLLIILTFWSPIISQNDFNEAKAKQIIDIFFEGFHEADTLKMQSVIADHVTMQSVFTSENEGHIVRTDDMNNFIKSVAMRPDTQKWEERLLNYSIQIDGNLAHVWTPYEFWFNDSFSHCGANAFTLVKTNEGWKIIHVIDSRRKSDCAN